MEVSIKIFLVIWALTPTEVPVFEKREMPDLSTCWAIAESEVRNTAYETREETDIKIGAACFLEKVPQKPA